MKKKLKFLSAHCNGRGDREGKTGDWGVLESLITNLRSEFSNFKIQDAGSECGGSNIRLCKYICKRWFSYPACYLRIFDFWNPRWQIKYGGQDVSLELITQRFFVSTMLVRRSWLSKIGNSDFKFIINNAWKFRVHNKFYENFIILSLPAPYWIRHLGCIIPKILTAELLSGIPKILK